MGASQSAPETQSELLARYAGADQRMLLRNCSLLAARDPSAPGSFGGTDWAGVHSAMPPALAAAIFRGLSGGADRLDTDTVLRQLVESCA